MLRNLVLKLPTLRTTSDYAFQSSLRLRNFRSMSPVHRGRSVDSERSMSCSRVKSGHVVDITRSPRTLNFCKKHIAQKHDSVKEIKWREDPGKKKEEKCNEEKKGSEPGHFETLEQYELEAAKPRPARNQDVIAAFSIPKAADNGLYHLQPSQIPPYGSQNTMYAPSLIRPTNLLKYPRKFKKKRELKQDKNSNSDLDSGCRNYCTTTDTRQISTSKRYVAKEAYSSRDVFKNPSITSINKKNAISKIPIPAKQESETKFNIVKQISQSYKEPWAEPKKKLEFSPPMFQTSNNVVEDIDRDFKFSTAEQRRQRKERENQNFNFNYKSSYSDLVKLKLKKMEERQLDLANLSPVDPKPATGKTGLEYFTKTIPKSSQILRMVKSIHEKRSLTTRSKSNLLSNEVSPIILDPATTLLSKKSVGESQEQRNYSKSKSRDHKGKKPKKTPGLIDRDECSNVCTPLKEGLSKLKKPQFPLEPKSCEPAKTIKKVYLPSNVKLGVPPCTPPPAYEECKKVEKCPPRADECLEITPKKLPKLPPNDCICIDPYQPTNAPKLKQLNLKFEDPPKAVCHVPPCQTPRADDCNPYKFKPLRPYVPGDCECVESPPMKDVKLKRLPKCEPEDVCRPPRICPVIEKCPPRADECLKIVPKRLPPIKPSECPCIDPPTPKMAPPIKRLCLKVPEPQRVCPKVIPCNENERADNHLKLKRKKLPKFVPGDCPCEDRPMIDWNPRRLVCEEDEEDCVVPDPCKTFPRADWGCWEYQDQVCKAIDVKCIEKDIKCPPPEPPKRHPCDKTNVCRDSSGGLREIRHMPKRRYSNSSTSLKLYQQVKSQHHCEEDGYIKTGKAYTYRPPVLEKSKTKATQLASNVKGFPTKKFKSKSTLSLVKMLNDFEKSKKHMDEPHLFKPKEDEKVNYEAILKKIAASGVPIPRNEPKVGYLSPSIKQSKSIPLKVTSRAISTNKNVGVKNEMDIKQINDFKGKKACKNMKPSIKSLACQKKPCPTINICRGKPREHRPSCKKERIPVCCEKEEAPYEAFTDKNPEASIRPFTTKTPQWNCDNPNYGFYPNPKREYDPFAKSKSKHKKNFSTYPELNNNMGIDVPSAPPPTACSGQIARIIPIVSTKELLKMSTHSQVRLTQNRTLSSKVFHIQRPPIGKPKPNKKCLGKSLVTSKSERISCDPPQETSKLRYCVREAAELNCRRKPPPFPAFSDCLDEEMEDILTECPLDKEKYYRMQPRFIGTKKPFTLKPPPPVQGKLDLLKEQECLREKLCIENKGLTQSCSEFGKPIPLMKTKKLIKEYNADCDRIEELKKLGRWPPSINYHRRLSTSAPATPSKTRRNLSTFGLNLMSEIAKSSSSFGAKRLYIRDYHALVNGTDKAILATSDAKLKELTKKIFPDSDECTKVLKLRNNQWNISSFKKYELLNRHGNVAKRARRFYTTYKTKRKGFLKRQVQGCTLKSGLIRRPVSNNAKLFRYRTTNLRGTRSLKSGNPLNIVKRRNKVDVNKKSHSKFTLNSGSPKGSPKDGNKKASEKYGHKPFTPFPAFSERKPFSGSSDLQHIQPMRRVLADNDHLAQQFPEQEALDRNLKFEYYKCKHGLKNEGTLDCQSLGFCGKDKHADDGSHDAETKFKPRRKSFVEVFVQEHKQSKETKSCKQCKRQPCSCQSTDKSNEEDCSEDKKKLEEICMQHCLKCIPCHLPEEEKYCACREECRKIFQKVPEEPLLAKQMKCKEEDICESNPKTTENIDCKPALETDCMEPEPIKKQKKLDNSFRYKADKMMECSDCPPAPCGTKILTKSNSITQVENIWQKIVNYFKARPNCPEPGEWKKRALKEKAEKAAKAAGLVVLNPKCLPPEILRTAKVATNDCKVCTTKDSGDKRDCDCDNNKSTSPRLTKRNFSTVVQQSRNYSRSMSSQNLKEINRLLDESEIHERQLKCRSSNPNLRKEFAIFSERKDFETSKALQMSLDNELSRYIDFEELCCKNGQHSRTYFGYSDIIPSRENILERAWRISKESYNKCNYPKSYTLFNEFFNKIEKSIQSVEDLEKLKTENVLRELDEFLKNEDSDKDNK